MRNKDDIKYVYDLVSRRIKFFRKHRGITQEKLAELTLFSRGLVGNIETQQTFSLAVLYCFARALDIPLELFVKEDITEELIALNIELPEQETDDQK